MILSQLIRGAAEELISRPGELVDPVLVGAAMARAADRAYGSVRDPAEGTILTVVREMAARVATRARAHGRAAAAAPRRRRRAERDARRGARARAATPARQSVKRGPELLPILREAGVVDAGGYGLTIIFAGVIAALRGAEPPTLEHHAPARDHPPAARVVDLPLLHELRRHRRGPRPARTGSTRSSALGDSVLVVGDAHTLKVHVHTDEPERATALFDERRRRSRTSTSPTCTSRSRSAPSASAEPIQTLRRARASSPATGMARAVRGPRRRRARRRRRR